MPWVRIDDRYPSHRKVGPLSDPAFRLDVSAWCWSAENLTDGHVGPDELALIPAIRQPAKAAAELVRRGRWHLPGHDCQSEHCRPIVDGWLIHDYLVYNKSAVEVRADRAAAAERQRRARSSRRNQSQGESRRDIPRDPLRDSQGTYGVSHDTGHTGSNGVSHRPPVPVPSPKGTGVQVEPSSSGGGRARDDDDLKIDKRIIELLYEANGRYVPPDWATKVRHQLLDDRQVANPLAYVAAAIRGEPRRYMPTDPPTGGVIDEPWMDTPPLGERDNEVTNSRGRAAVDDAIQHARQARADDGPEGGENRD